MNVLEHLFSLRFVGIVFGVEEDMQHLKLAVGSLQRSPAFKWFEVVDPFLVRPPGMIQVLDLLEVA